MLLVIDLEIAPKKKIPIIAQIILSKAIAGENPWPELIISVSGSKGSKFNLINNINYKGLNKWKIKTYKRNNQNHNINQTQKSLYSAIFKEWIFLDMQVDVQNTTILSADGSSIKLGEYSGEVILVVNVASYCGNTAQYEDLQKLHDYIQAKA